MKSRFFLYPKKLIAGKYFGQFQSIFSWLGTEASDVRPYTPGDSAKVINWKTSAKHQQLYSNVYQQEKAIQIDIFRDVNYNWNGELQGKKNYERVRECMSDIFLYVKTYGATLNMFYTKRTWRLFGAQRINELIIWKHYDKAIPLMYELSNIAKKMPRHYSSNLSTFLQRMAMNKKRRAIVIFSDFLDVSEQEKKHLQQLKKEHVLVLFQLPIDKYLWQNYDSGMIREEKSVWLEVMKL